MALGLPGPSGHQRGGDGVVSWGMNWLDELKFAMNSGQFVVCEVMLMN